jgi:hypothetical protein
MPHVAKLRLAMNCCKVVQQRISKSIYVSSTRCVIKLRSVLDTFLGFRLIEIKRFGSWIYFCFPLISLAPNECGVNCPKKHA